MGGDEISRSVPHRDVQTLGTMSVHMSEERRGSALGQLCSVPKIVVQKSCQVEFWISAAPNGIPGKVQGGEGENMFFRQNFSFILVGTMFCSNVLLHKS